MIRKKWTGGEPVLSVETEDEFHKALPLGLPIEVSPEIAEGIGLMEEDVGTLEESNAEKPRSGVTSSTGWPSSVGHRRTLLVGNGPVSRVRCGPVPIHAPTPSRGGISPASAAGSAAVTCSQMLLTAIMSSVTRTNPCGTGTTIVFPPTSKVSARTNIEVDRHQQRESAKEFFHVPSRC